MDRLKGRLLGAEPQVSQSSASGVWLLKEQQGYASLGVWPDYRQGQVYEFSSEDSGVINLGSNQITETLRYSGSGVTTSRVVNLSGTTGGGVILANGSGPIVFSQDFTATGSGSKTLTLSGTNTGNNQVAAIVDPSSGRTSLMKTGTGTWVLSATSTYTGATRILAGRVVSSVDSQYNGSGAFGYANNGFSFDGSFMEVGEEGGGAVALILAPGYKFSRYIQVPAGTHPVTLGGGNNSQFRQDFIALLGRDVVLQAATDGKVYFGGYFDDATGQTAATTNFVVGSPGNEGTVVIRRPGSQIDTAFITSGSVTVSHGTLHISKQADGPFGFGGWIDASQVVIDGNNANLNYSADTSFPLEAPLTINTGLLYGSGTISAVGGVAVGAGAIISPGDPVGEQSYTTGVTLAPGGTYLWCIDDWTGTGYGKLNVTGGLSITATSSNKAKVMIMGLNGSGEFGSVPNFSNSSNASFTIAACDSLTGFDASKFEIDDSLFSPNNSLGGGSWSLSQSGDDLILTFTHA